MAQLVEQRIRNAWVRGSSPLIGFLEAKMSKVTNFFVAKQKLIALIIYGLLFIGAVLVTTLVLHYPVVAVCVIFLAEAIVCCCIHIVPLWVQGCVLLVELIAGVLALRIVLIALGIVVYLITFGTLKFLARR